MPSPPTTTQPRDGILVVEDDPNAQALVARTLQPHFQVHTAPDTEAAETVLRRHRIAVVLCDHVLPGEDGISFLTRLRSIVPDIQRVLMTGQSSEELALRGINEAQLFSFIVKPFSIATLLDTTQKAYQAWEAASENAHSPPTPASTPSQHDSHPHKRTSAHHPFRLIMRPLIVIALVTGVSALILGFFYLLLYVLKTVAGIDLIPPLWN